METEKAAVDQTRVRYDRIAWVYDPADFLVEQVVFRRWRQRIWSLIPPARGLEVGVGTGKNMPFYPPGSQITAVDLSPKMIEKARRRKEKLALDVELTEMNVEELEFDNDSFDWAVATFVFCSVPYPVQGLQELSRVVKPRGQIYLLEHVRIDKPVLGALMDLFNPLAVRLTGANINRQTLRHIEESGLNIEQVTSLGPFGIAKLITARP